MITPTPFQLSDQDIQRFLQYLQRDEATGCLLWIGATQNKGYGVFGLSREVDGKRKWRVSLAHRIAWEVLGKNKHDPKLPFILHNCPHGDNPRCCEPTHLWAGTQADNMRDRAVRGAVRTSGLGLPYGVRVDGERFVAQSNLNNRAVYLGRFDTAEEAHEKAKEFRDSHAPNRPRR